MSERKRVKQETSFHDRLKLFSDELKAKAATLRPGPERDEILKRARRADTASHIDQWANSVGLQSPK